MYDALERDVERVEKALVFGQRNVEQVRGTMSRAGSEPEGSHERSRLYQAAQLARATATIFPRKYKSFENGRCIIGEGQGSATLSSDSRMVTAHHVIHGAIEDYPAYFESQPTVNASNRSDAQVGIIPADAKASDYPETWEAIIAHRSDEVEESPFLANRLFMMSLDGWAHQGIGTNARIALRKGFRFIVDTIQPGHDNYSPQTEGSQGFVSSSGMNYIGRDIAVLRVNRNSQINSEFKHLSTGNFPIAKPAVFFGKVQMKSSKEHPIKRNNFLNHTAPWPEIAPNQQTNLVPLTSFNALFANLNDTTVGNLCRGPEEVKFSIKGLFQTSFDASSGSSGGIVFTPHSFARPSGFTGSRPLVGIGVLSGPQGKIGILPKHTYWGKPVNQTRPTSDASIGITSTSVNDIEIFERDTVVGTIDPAKPTPIIEGKFPKCEQYNDAGDCIRFETSDPPPPTTSGGFGPPKGVPILTGADAEKVGANIGRRFQCSNHKIGVPAPIMVGIQGGLALYGMNVSASPETIVDNGGGIGSFLGICAPYSSVPYTDNWRFLSIVGAQMPRELDSLGGPYGWGTFDEYQSRIYEERSVKGEVYVRPPSTKMCPPNYLLRGVDLAIEHEKDRHYSGVRGLLCSKPPSLDMDIPEEITTLLVEKEANYTLEGKPFGLTQLIGLPDTCGYSECARIECREGDAVQGMTTYHDKKGRLTFLKLKCIKAP